MLLQNTLLPSLTLTTSPPAISKSWQVGQILQAIVQGRKQQGYLLLKIGNNTLSASTTLAYQSGQKLKLQVIENRKSLVLQNLEPGKAGSKETTLEQLLEQLLRQALPKQDKLQSLAKNLNQLLSKLQAPIQGLSTTSKPVFEQLLSTQRALPGAEQLVNPRLLKQTIKDSGLFLEAKLAALLPLADKPTGTTTTNPIRTDLKANLLVLANTIEQSLKTNQEELAIKLKASVSSDTKNVDKNYGQRNIEAANDVKVVELLSLRRAVESAIAKLQLNQSQAIITAEQSSPIWVIDLPIVDEQHENMLELKIRHEEAESQQDSRTRKWTVTLSFDIAPLGKIHVQLKLLGEKLSSSIWAEQILTNNLIRQHLSYLEKRLQQSGLNVVTINQHPVIQQGSIDVPRRPPLVSTVI